MRGLASTLGAALSVACLRCTLLVDTEGLAGAAPSERDSSAADAGAGDGGTVVDAGTDARRPPEGSVTGPNGHRYLVVIDPAISWGAAAQKAVSLGGHLATITSLEENAFIAGLLAQTPGAWIENFYGPWIGARQAPGAPEPAGGWEWVTGELFTFTRWASNEPSNEVGPDGSQDSLQFLNRAGAGDVWNDNFAVTNNVSGYVVEFE